MLDACPTQALTADVDLLLQGGVALNVLSGVLVAKARGDLTSLHADFLAVEARMATPRFVRRAHRAGQDVWVWTVNDPADMRRLIAMGLGTLPGDGMISDYPDRLMSLRRGRQ